MRTLAYRSIAFACVAAATACGALASTRNEGSLVDASATLDASVARDATAADANAPQEAGDARDTTDLDAAMDAPAAVICPPMLPESGAPCSPPPSVVDWDGPYDIFWQCEYGSDPHCRARAECFFNPAGGDTWSVFQADPSCAGNPPACPASFDDGVGVDCPVQGSCTYPEGRCSCVQCGVTDSGGPVPAWSCARWDEPDAWVTCIGPPPDGEACTPEGWVYDAMQPYQQCCAGLAPIDPNFEPASWCDANGECVPQGSTPGCVFTIVDAARLCTTCGNGVCEEAKGENPCNCPVDCSGLLDADRQD